MIRKAKIEELEEIKEIFEEAKKIMRQDGNMLQWNDGYPQDEVLISDIDKGQLCVIEDGEINACFGLQLGEDPTYKVIDGKWQSDSPYITIHRIAKRSGKHIFDQMFSYVKERYDHIRIDTHKDNKIMQHLLAIHGFKYCGIIYLLDGDPRLAYEYIKRY